jgi:hypothetical protein
MISYLTNYDKKNNFLDSYLQVQRDIIIHVPYNQIIILISFFE